MILESDFLYRHFQVIQKGLKKNISSIASHSEKVQENSLFIALKGEKQDGHNFLKEAVKNGAAALLVEKTEQVPENFRGIVLKTRDTRSSLSFLLNELYNFPSKKLFTVAVTGTNGKTSTAFMIEHLFRNCGWRTGLIGTIQQSCGDKQWSSRLTTPEPVELFERLNDFLKLDAKALVIEVSSIGLQQKRVKGLDFNINLFTNLSQDHIDYHKNTEAYFQSKKTLFNRMDQSQGHSIAIINKDDQFGQRLLKELKGPCLSLGSKNADFFFKIKEKNYGKTLFTIHTPQGVADILLPLAGTYNVYNAVSACASALMAGFSLESCRKALESFPGVPGRLEWVTPADHPFQLCVDYAHTPDALRAVLTALKDQLDKGRIVTVFGCGGGRDREKRGEMTKIALKLSDKVILTSDNPRWESPSQIINDCLLPVKDKSSVLVCWDRKQAIKESIVKASPGDCILIAGKGHETFQIIEGEKYPFNDKKIAESFLNFKKNPP